MRTTIDLPDDLFRQVKARAALDGMKLRELIARYVELGLKGHGRETGSPRDPVRSALPLIPEAKTGKQIPAQTNRQLAELELEDDLEKLHRSAGR